jgi:hypothetical protein
MPLPSLPDALEAAMQAPQAITMTVDPGKMIIGAALGVVGVVIAGLKFLGGRLLKAVDAVGEKVDDTAVTVTKMNQELFGPDGTNGMRSDVKRMSRQMEVDRIVLIQLAAKEGLDVPERIP